MADDDLEGAQDNASESQDPRETVAEEAKEYEKRFRSDNFDLDGYGARDPSRR